MYALIIAVFLILNAGCGAALNGLREPPTATPTALATNSAPDIAINTLQPPPTATPSCATSSKPLSYDADVVVEYPRKTLTATLHTTYLNQTGAPVSTLVFHIPQGSTKNAFFLTSLSAEPAATRYEVRQTVLSVTLNDPLPENCAITVTMGFRLNVFPIPEGNNGVYGYYGYSERQFNLGDWLPTLAPHLHGDWYIPKEWGIGETEVTDSASYHVALTLQDAVNPQKLEVAGPGDVKRLDATHWTFDLDHARNFALSISDAFKKQSTITSDGVIIDLYSLPNGAGSTSANFALDTAAAAISTFERLFGSCPYRRIAVVQGDFPDGMEFSGLVFVSTRWFTLLWEGRPDSWLTVITTHELAHQYWYSSVGDDQGQSPYLDESFAIYSEVLYLEKDYPDLVKWWWKWRVEQYKPMGSVDSTVYEFSQGRPYINAVYLRGAQMLQEIRVALGDEAFFAWLRAYATTQADRITTPAALWGLLSASDYTKTADIRAHYLKNADPLGSVKPVAATTAEPTEFRKNGRTEPGK